MNEKKPMRQEGKKGDLGKYTKAGRKKRRLDRLELFNLRRKKKKLLINRLYISTSIEVLSR